MHTTTSAHLAECPVIVEHVMSDIMQTANHLSGVLFGCISMRRQQTQDVDVWKLLFPF